MLKSKQPHTHTQRTDLPNMENQNDSLFFWRIYQIIPLNISFLKLMENVRGKGRYQQCRRLVELCRREQGGSPSASLGTALLSGARHQISPRTVLFVILDSDSLSKSD